MWVACKLGRIQINYDENQETINIYAVNDFKRWRIGDYTINIAERRILNNCIYANYDTKRTLKRFSRAYTKIMRSLIKQLGGLRKL